MNRSWTCEETVEMGKCAIKGMTSGLEKAMNPPEDVFEGQADIMTDGAGKNENALLDERIQMAILKAIKKGNHIEIHPSKAGVKIYEVKKRIIE